MALKEISDLVEKVSINSTDFLHVKQGSEDVKIKPQVLFDLHIAAPNPHNITKTTVGLGNVTDDAQLAISNNLSDLDNDVTARTNLGVYSTTETDTQVNNHASLTNNPHAVTKSQVGLGNVPNYTISNDPNEAVTTKFASIKAVNDVQVQVDDINAAVIPSGAIMMWSGAVIPTGWQICDGTNGTPNLVDRFIRGGTTGTVNSTGGIDSQKHGHTGAISGHALVESELPEHRHFIVKDAQYQDSTRSTDKTIAADFTLGGSTTKYQLRSVLEGLDADVGPTSPVGSGAEHTHGFSIDDSVTLDNKPPFYTLIFIQKI